MNFSENYLCVLPNGFKVTYEAFYCLSEEEKDIVLEYMVSLILNEGVS